MKYIKESITLTLVCAVLMSYAAIPIGQAEEKTDLPSGDEFVKVDVPPEMIKLVDPMYPPEARQKGIEGKVVISSLVDKTGRPAKVKIAESSGHKILDKAALKAAREIIYRPAIRNGQPVAVWISYTVTFTMGECGEEKAPE